MPKASKSRPKLLSSSRPPASVSASNADKASKASHLSSKTTRSVIRTHHTLQKQLSHALAANDASKVKELETRLEANGGLILYQLASTQGQRKDRGGDTSRVLVEWLRDSGVLPLASHQQTKANNGLDGGVRKREGEGLRILEVGALSTQNALSIEGVTKLRKIDLHSQHQEIEEMDLMKLDAEGKWEGERGYDVLSLSLVVNFVGDARERGKMLRHTIGFLRHETKGKNGLESEESNREKLLPALFLVLPLPCVDNSRYLTEDRLSDIMKSLGYEKTRVKRSGKLYYSLWRLGSPSVSYVDGVEEDVAKEGVSRTFKKGELRKGKDRNNFCIILDDAS